MIGEANGWWSFLRLDDAAAATANAVERGRPGIDNVVDDEPAPSANGSLRSPRCSARSRRGEFRFGSRLAVPPRLIAMMTEIRAGSNAKAKRELGGSPSFLSWRTGFAEVFAAMR